MSINGEATSGTAEPGALEEVIVEILRPSRRHPVPFDDVRQEVARRLEYHRASNLASSVDKLVEAGRVIAFSRGRDLDYFWADNLTYLKTRLCAILNSHHTRHPYEAGMNTGDIKKHFSESRTLNARRNIDARLFDLALTACKADGLVTDCEAGVRLTSFQPRAADDQATVKLEKALLAYIEAHPFAKTKIDELSLHLEVDPRQTKAVVAGLLKSGRLVRFQLDHYVPPDTLERARLRLAAAFAERPRLYISDILTLLKLSRRVTIPLMEYFDGTGFTRRIGDYRQLNPQAAQRQTSRGAPGDHSQALAGTPGPHEAPARDEADGCARGPTSACTKPAR